MRKEEEKTKERKRRKFDVRLIGLKFYRRKKEERSLIKSLIRNPYKKQRKLLIIFGGI